MPISPLLLAAALTAGPLATLRSEHPRIYFRPGDIERLKTRIERDAEVGALYRALQARVPELTAQPTAQHKPEDINADLEEARNALERIATLAGLYLLDHDPAKAARAKQEMLALADFPDWTPAHFLDVAETTHAMALGYDWLYDVLSPAERDKVAGAIAEKGLKAGLAAYRRADWWTRLGHMQNNWGYVCNAGLILGAVAVGDREPALSAQALDTARWSLIPQLDTLAPDGGWEEGPGYWRYGVSYAAYAVASLESALGTDLGLKRRALGEAGRFRIHLTGPTGKLFNFADSTDHGANRVPAMFWLARAYGRPVYAADEWPNAKARPSIFHLVWAPSRGVAPRPALDARFRGTEVATFRGSWGDPRAVYLAFKGGNNAANHSHLDLGSFVLDAGGERLALDPGPDNYGLPGYFGMQRYRYYRLGTAGHNTLTLDGENQVSNAMAPLISYRSTRADAHAVADLSHAYPGKVTRAWRGVALLERTRVLIQDELEPIRPVAPTWHLHTRAAVTLDGARATLQAGNTRWVARVLEPAGARFSLRGPTFGPGEEPAPDLRDLTVELPAGSAPVRLAVVLGPDDRPVPIRSLKLWGK